MSLRIWFVPSNGSHLGKFRPLMDALRDRGDDVGLLDVDAAHPAILAARPQIEASGYKHVSLPTSAYDPDAHWLRQAAQRAHLERAFSGLLDGIQADALIFGYDSFVSGRTFIRVARARRIATVLIPDGLVVAANESYRRPALVRAKHLIGDTLQQRLQAGGRRGLSGVDRILVINAMGRNVLVGHGVPADVVAVVGSPEYDALAARRAAGREPRSASRLRRRLGLPEERPVVFFAHQTLDGTDRSLVRAMLRGTRRCGAVLLTKLHPRGEEKPETWRSWAGSEGIPPSEAAFVGGECSTIEALEMSAACITAYSTVSLEAFICGCPLVLIQYVNVPYALPYGRLYGAALDARGPEELERHIVAVVQDAEVRSRLEEGRRKALLGELGGLDGKSVERSIAAIERTIADRKAAHPTRRRDASRS